MLVTRTKGTILVVDDSPEMLRYFRALLELDAYRVQTASDGVEALQCLESGAHPDIVLLDLEMPRLDGMRTLRRIRKLHPDLKVIMCSGGADSQLAQEAVELGAASYLTKPVDHLYLTAALERCLKQKPEAQGQAPSSSVVPFRRPDFVVTNRK
jgi:CheY-like chemotaxis protein